MQVGGRETHNFYFYGINCTFYFIFIFCSSYFVRSIAALTEKLSAISHPDKASVSVFLFTFFFIILLLYIYRQKSQLKYEKYTIYNI